jgi:hypothetical protein
MFYGLLSRVAMTQVGLELPWLSAFLLSSLEWPYGGSLSQVHTNCE